MKSFSKEQLYVRVKYSYFFSSSHRICFYAFLGERSWLLWRQSCFDECRWEDTLCWQGSRWVFFSLLFRHIAPKQKGLLLTNPVTLIRQKAHGAQVTSSNPRSIPCFSQLTVRPWLTLSWSFQESILFNINWLLIQLLPMKKFKFMEGKRTFAEFFGLERHPVFFFLCTFLIRTLK